MTTFLSILALVLAIINSAILVSYLWNATPAFVIKIAELAGKTSRSVRDLELAVSHTQSDLETALEPIEAVVERAHQVLAEAEARIADLTADKGTTTPPPVMPKNLAAGGFVPSPRVEGAVTEKIVPVGTPVSGPDAK